MNAMKRCFTFFFGSAAVCVLLSPATVRGAGCGQIKLDATEAVAAAPGNHKVILENDLVRVLEVKVPLHSREIPHTHFWPSVFFEQTSGLDEPWKTVKIRWSESGPAKGFASSDRDRHNLLIELKDVDCQPAPAAGLPATDAGSIHDPNISVALENAYVRVLSIRVPPGEKEPWHTHTWPAVVVHFRVPATMRLSPDGKKTPQPELKEMRVTFDASSQPLHALENLGPDVDQAYRIEIKPVTKIAAVKAAR